MEERGEAHPCIDCSKIVRWALARCIDCAAKAGGKNLSYLRGAFQHRKATVTNRVISRSRVNLRSRGPNKSSGRRDPTGGRLNGNWW